MLEKKLYLVVTARPDSRHQTLRTLDVEPRMRLVQNKPLCNHKRALKNCFLQQQWKARRAWKRHSPRTLFIGGAALISAPRGPFEPAVNPRSGGVRNSRARCFLRLHITLKTRRAGMKTRRCVTRASGQRACRELEATVNV